MQEREFPGERQPTARSSPLAFVKSSFDNIIEQSRLSGAHYDVTITQGNRRLMLKFKDKKLVDVQKEGLE